MGDAILMFQLMRKTEASIGVPEAGEQLLRLKRRCVVLASVTLTIYIIQHAVELQEFIPLLGSSLPVGAGLWKLLLLVVILVYKGTRIAAVQSFGGWLSLKGGFIPAKEEKPAGSETCPATDLESGAPGQVAMDAN